jgi:WhiB family redox-sensing transcriptional regulator
LTVAALFSVRAWEPTPWAEEAACRSVPNPNIFFPDANDWASTEQAKTLCSGCPVRVECADYGASEAYGIFGGRTPSERKAERQAAQRGQLMWAV